MSQQADSAMWAPIAKLFVLTHSTATNPGCCWSNHRNANVFLRIALYQWPFLNWYLPDNKVYVGAIFQGIYPWNMTLVCTSAPPMNRYLKWPLSTLTKAAINGWARRFGTGHGRAMVGQWMGSELDWFHNGFSMIQLAKMLVSWGLRPPIETI